MGKPAQQIFEHVEREAQIDSAHTIYVDDLEKNRKAGEKFLGWQTCASVDELKEILNN